VTSTEELVALAADLVADGQRRLLGITGLPGAGKSTVSRVVAGAMGDRVVVVPMDGFHLAQTELERLGRADRKGAPDTFDAAGFVALLRRLRDAVPGVTGTVYAPEYRRELRNGVAGAIAVPDDVPLVLVEGNYLLLATDGFAPVASMLDRTWFVEVDEDVRIEQLVARHVAYGKTPEAARAWTLGSDQRNAETIARSRGRADVVVRLTVP
jgi:pantothenate kinase